MTCKQQICKQEKFFPAGTVSSSWKSDLQKQDISGFFEYWYDIIHFPSLWSPALSYSPHQINLLTLSGPRSSVLDWSNCLGPPDEKCFGNSSILWIFNLSLTQIFRPFILHFNILQEYTYRDEKTRQSPRVQLYFNKMQWELFTM